MAPARQSRLARPDPVGRIRVVSRRRHAPLRVLLDETSGFEPREAADRQCDVPPLRPAFVDVDAACAALAF